MCDVLLSYRGRAIRQADVDWLRVLIAANPQSVADYKAGKKKAIGFLVGQIMKETKGRANPGVVNQLLTKNLQ